MYLCRLRSECERENNIKHRSEPSSHSVYLMEISPSPYIPERELLSLLSSHAFSSHCSRSATSSPDWNSSFTTLTRLQSPNGLEPRLLLPPDERDNLQQTTRNVQIEHFHSYTRIRQPQGQIIVTLQNVLNKHEGSRDSLATHTVPCLTASCLKICMSGMSCGFDRYCQRNTENSRTPSELGGTRTMNNPCNG